MDGIDALTGGLSPATARSDRQDTPKRVGKGEEFWRIRAETLELPARFCENDDRQGLRLEGTVGGSK